MTYEERCGRCGYWGPTGSTRDNVCFSCLALVGLMPDTLRQRRREFEAIARNGSPYAGSAWDEVSRIDGELRRRGLTQREAA